MSYVSTQFTLADAIHAIEARPEVGHSPKRRVEIVRDIRIVATWLDREPAEVPASIHALQERLRGFHHGQLGISKGRFRNILSSLRRGLEAVRTVHDVTRLRPDTELPPVWQALYHGIPAEKKWLKGILNPFIRWCADHDVAPRQVTETTFTAWADWRRQQTVTLARDPERAVRRAIDAWNHARRALDWPVAEVKRPSRRKVVTRPWDSFSAAFRADVDAFVRAHSKTESEIPEGRIARLRRRREAGRLKPLSVRTMKLRQEAVRLAASHMLDNGLIAVDDLVSLDQVAQPEIAEHIVDAMIARNATGKPTEYALSTVKSLCNIAHRLGPVAPAIEEEWRCLIAEVKEEANVGHDMTETNLRRLAQFFNEHNVRQLLWLPQALMDEAEAERKRLKRVTPTIGATAQAAAAIALLITLPVRRQNLVAIEEEKHIQWPVGRRNRSGFLSFEAAEVKNRRGLSAEIPDDMMNIIRLYRRVYRPHLCERASENPYLFPAQNGLGHKDANALTALVTRRIRSRTGLDMTVHFFRHVLATLLLMAKRDYRLVTDLLGHSPDSRISRRYARLAAALAAQDLDEILAEKRGRKATRRP